MQISFRGQPNSVDVPDQPAPSTSTPSFRGATDHIDTPATNHADSHVTDRGDASAVLAAESFPPIVTGHDALVTQSAAPIILPTFDGASSALGISWFAHSDALPQFAPVASVVTDGVAGTATRGGDLGSLSGFGDGDIGRGGEIAPLALNASDFSDHGWFIVPSATAEYGDGHVDMAAVDGFVFDMAAGEFTSDWFLV